MWRSLLGTSSARNSGIPNPSSIGRTLGENGQFSHSSRNISTALTTLILFIPERAVVAEFPRIGGISNPSAADDAIIRLISKRTVVAKSCWSSRVSDPSAAFNAVVDLVSEAAVTAQLCGRFDHSIRLGENGAVVRIAFTPRNSFSSEEKRKDKETPERKKNFVEHGKTPYLKAKKNLIDQH